MLVHAGVNAVVSRTVYIPDSPDIKVYCHWNRPRCLRLHHRFSEHRGGANSGTTELPTIRLSTSNWRSRQDWLAPQFEDRGAEDQQGKSTAERLGGVITSVPVTKGASVGALHA